jgi:hypothetical protein
VKRAQFSPLSESNAIREYRRGFRRGVKAALILVFLAVLTALVVWIEFQTAR